MSQYNDERKIIVIEKYKEYIEKMPAFVKDFFNFYEISKNAAPNTILAYAYDLDAFFYYLMQTNPMIQSYGDITLEILDQLTLKDIQDYMSFLVLYKKEGKVLKNSEEGRARKLACLRSFYRYYVNAKDLHNNPAAAMPVPTINEKAVISLDPEEIQDIMAHVDTASMLSNRQQEYAKKTHYRDIALTTLLVGTGIRVSECVGINLSDIDWTRKSIVVLRKGQKEQLVFFNETVAQALEDYILFEREPIDTNDDALFISLKGTRITVRSVERIVKKFSQPVISNRKITPHKMRSSFGTNLYEETQDPLLVKDALGHSNLSVVQKYVKENEKRRQEASIYADSWLKKEEKRHP